MVSRFACNARVIVNVSSNPTVSHVKIAVTKPRINSSIKQTNIASLINQSNGNLMRWQISSSSSLVNTSVAIKIGDSLFTCKVANKCLNVCERQEVVEWTKRWSPPTHAVLWIVSVCEKNPWKKKFSIIKTMKNLYFVNDNKYRKYHTY